MKFEILQAMFTGGKYGQTFFDRVYDGLFLEFDIDLTFERQNIALDGELKCQEQINKYYESCIVGTPFFN